MIDPPLLAPFAALIVALDTPDPAERRAALDAARLADHRSADPSRRDWSHFLGQNAHLLAPHGAPALLQFALEEGTDSPITAAARRWIALGRAPEPAWEGSLRVPRRHGYLTVVDGRLPAVFAPRQGWLVTADNRELRCWDPETGALLRTIESPDARPMQWHIPSFVLHRDGRNLSARVYVSTPDGTRDELHLWDLGRGERTAVIPLPDKTRGVRVADDRRVAILEVDGAAVRLDLVTGERAVLAEATYVVGIDASGQRFFGARGGERIGIYDTATGERIGDTGVPLSFHGNEAQIRHDPRTGLVAVWAQGPLRGGSLVSIHDPITGERRWSALLPEQYFVELLPDGALSTMTWEPGDAPRWRITRWDLATGKPLGEALLADIGVGSIHPLADGRHLITFGPTICRVDLTTGASETLRWDHHPAHLWPGTPLVSPDGRRLVTLHAATKSILLWDIDTPRHALPAPGAESDDPILVYSPIELLVPLPDGRRVAAVQAAPVGLWDVVTGERIALLPDERGTGWSGVAAFADGRRLLTLNYERHVIWDLAAETPLHDTWTDLGFHFAHLFPDGRRALVAHPKEGVCILDLEEGKELSWIVDDTYMHHQHAQIALSPAGDRVAARVAAPRDAIGIFDAATGALLHRLPAESAAPWGLAFLIVDGRLELASSHGDGLRRWDVATGACLGVHPIHCRAQAFAIDPDHPRALFGGDEGVLWLVDVVSGEVVARHFARAPLRACAALGGGRYAAGDMLGGLYFLTLRAP